MKKITLLTILSAFMVSCGGDVKIPSSGRPYEIIVVAQMPIWSGVAGDTLRAIFGAEVEMINQSEPIFDLLIVPPQNYNNVGKRQRNIIVLNTGSQYPSGDMSAEIDLEAAPQLKITIQAPTPDSLASFIGSYANELVAMFDIAERDRLKARAIEMGDREINAEIKKSFDIEMSIPQGYYIAENKPGFMWIRNEMPLSSIGFVIYDYEPDSVTVANNDKAGNILANLEVAISRIPGPSEGSYMVTSRVFAPDQKRLTIDGRTWNQLRGFWEVEGDFMGGPYIDYTTYDESRNRMVGIYGYVFNPSPNASVGKRNMIRQIEAVFMTANIPEKQ